MKAKALRDITSEDLIVKEKGLKKDLFELNFQKKLGSVEKPSSFRLIKRDIARILTILKERKLNDGK
ncbi:MAG: 50S ribosomal protein L29 [Candidatus Omnitrophica bacterium]|nr:50S ribosomal protein L29 [Candidatus Omnitrophota bacterium]